MPRRLLAALLAAWTLLPLAASGAVDHERWAIKTHFRHPRQKPKLVALSELKRLPSFTQDKWSDFDASYIPDSPGEGLHEGDMVKTRGWIQALKYSADDDDYHIQMVDDSTGGSECFIVEVPKAGFEALRRKILTTCSQGKYTEFSRSGNRMEHPVPCVVAGQLFYDASHGSDPGARGIKGRKASTAWEIHPVKSVTWTGHPKRSRPSGGGGEP